MNREKSHISLIFPPDITILPIQTLERVYEARIY